MRGLRFGWVLAALLWGACGGPQEGEEGAADAPPGTAVQELYTSALTTRWVRSNPQVSFHQVAIDAGGNVFTTFQYSGSVLLEGAQLPWNGDAQDPHLGVAKFRPNGSLAWVRGYGPSVPSTDPGVGFYVYPTALAVTRAGTVFVGGEAQGSGVRIGGQQLGNGQFLLSLRSDGRQRWARSTRPEPGTVFTPLAFAARPDGGFYALATFRRLAESRFPQLMLIRYRSDGVALWGNIYDQPEGSSVDPLRVASDEAGNAYVSGFSSGPVSFGGATGGGDTKPFVFSTSRSGRHRWTRFIPVAERGYATGLIARGGRVVVAVPTSSGDSFLLGLTTGNGAQRWRRALGSVGTGVSVATSVHNEVVLCASGGDASALGVPRSTPTEDVARTTAFVARFRRSDGRIGRARNLELSPGGPDDRLDLQGCAMSDASSVAVTGGLQGTLDLGTGPLSGVPSFLVRMTP